jgi:hypothetical protein
MFLLFLNTKQCHFLLIFFLRITLSVRDGTKTDFTELISPTDRTNVGRRNNYRLLAASCRWRLGVSAVTADGR